MPADNVRDAKMIQYLTEAYGNEKRRESALRSQIPMASRAPYKKRLRGHLAETRRHERELEDRITDLGGSVGGLPIPGPADIAGAVLGRMRRATAIAQRPLDAVRGMSAAERQLRNAKAEFCEEAQEVGTYSAIQTFAEKVGDRETAALAGAILREEQRMAAFLEQEIALQASAVATAEVPARLRTGERRRRTAERRPRAAASRGAGAPGRSRVSSRTGAAAPGGRAAQQSGSSEPETVRVMPPASGPDTQSTGSATGAPRPTSAAVMTPPSRRRTQVGRGSRHIACWDQPPAGPHASSRATSGVAVACRFA